MEVANKDPEATALATDITGVWKISWTDEINNKGEFEIEIQNGPKGLPYIVTGMASLPFDSGFLLGNQSVSGQSIVFTIGVFIGGRTGSFNFNLPKIGGSGTFDGSALLCDGLKNTNGTCVSTKVK